MIFQNPFDIIKAVDYSDKEILDYWVDYGEGSRFFRDLILKSKRVPLMLMGSKGSGKTHLMRYFSFNIQKMRYEIDQKTFDEDGFVGVYLRCSGFSTDRFESCENDKLFQYYWELWLGQLTINIFSNLKSMGLIIDAEELRFCDKIKEFIRNENSIDIASFQNLEKFLKQLQNQIDYQVAEIPFNSKKLQVEPKVLPNSLTFNIPVTAKDTISFFSNKSIMYLIDEYENIGVKEQQVVQTLIREKSPSYSFVIGSRLYGFKTSEVLGGESNREGSEYCREQLDEYLRKDDKKYSSFIKNIYLNRVKKYPQDCKKILDYDEGLFPTLLNQKRKKISSVPYLKKLRDAIAKYLEGGDRYADEIIENVKDKDTIKERVNVLAVLKFWKSFSGDKCDLLLKLLEMSRRIYKGKYSDIEEISAHFKLDMMDVLCKEFGIKDFFYSERDLIKLSLGTPRVFLNILKFAYNQYIFDHAKDPFYYGGLDLDSIRWGIIETIDCFYRENAIPNCSFDYLVCLDRLGKYLQAQRYSDVPPQCSISLFSLNLSNVSQIVRNNIKELENHSFLIKTNDRNEKNERTTREVYHINYPLLPRWGLSLQKRGDVVLDIKTAEAIFDVSKDENVSILKEIQKQKEKECNLPFMKQRKKPCKKIIDNALNLFDDEI